MRATLACGGVARASAPGRERCVELAGGAAGVALERLAFQLLSFCTARYSTIRSLTLSRS